MDPAALELQGRGELPAVRRPLVRQEPPPLHLLDPGEPPVGGLDPGLHLLEHVGMGGELGERAEGDAARPRPLRRDLRVEGEERDRVRPALTVGERLADQRVLLEVVLDVELN